MRVSVKGLPAGTYEINIYRVGYQVNDVYADYMKIGSPQTMTREQVRELAGKNDGRSISASRVRVTAGSVFIRDLPMRGNEAYLVTLERSNFSPLRGRS